MATQEFSETFRISGSMKGLMLFGLLFFGGGLLLSIALPFFMPEIFKIIWIWVPVIIGYCLIVKLFLKAWQERDDYITATNKGIALYSPETQKEFIKWGEISEIKENNIFERLILFGKNNKIIKIEYELTDLNNLLNILINNIPHLTKEYTALTTFHRTIHLHLFYTVALLFIVPFIAYGIYSKSYFIAIGFTLFSVLVVYLLLVEFIKIEIEKTSINTVFPLWEKRINLSQIREVTLENIRGSDGKAARCVLLKLNSGKTIRLNAVKEGTIALYSSIKNKLKNS